MRLLKLVLHKYCRLRLSLTETLTFEPSAPTQIFVGTNGSGKSSLLQECSPLVPEKSDFAKGGYKHAIFELEGVIYEVRNAFDDEHPHSFKRNDIELNVSGKITVQNDLIKQYFRYTPEIHALITGQIKFTRMSAAERKRWFTVLPAANYDYAVSVFKRVTERYNENRHALKRCKDRLMIESAKLLPADQLEQLRNDASLLYGQVQSLIEKRQPLLAPAEDFMNQSHDLTKSLADVASSVRTLIKRMNPKLPKNLQQLRDLVVAERQKLVGLQHQANQLFADHERMRSLWEAMQASHLENAAQIQSEIDACEKTIVAQRKLLTTAKEPLQDANTTIASCDKLLAWWPSMENHLHDNRDKNWGRAMFNSLNEEIAGIQTRLEQAKSLRDRAIQTIEHHESHSAEEAVKCPKCSHQFQPNFSAETLQIAQRRQREMAEAVKVFETELSEKQELREQIQKYFNSYSAVVQQVRNSPGMESFYDWMAKENILLYTPALFTHHLQRYRDDAGRWAQIEAAQVRINQARELAEQLQARENASGGAGIQAERERLEALIGEVEYQKTLSQEYLASLTTQQQMLEQLQTHEQKLMSGCERIDALHQQAADSLRREIFAQMLRELQSQLAFKEQALLAAERQQSVIDHINSEIEALTEATADCKLLQQELSPTDGLIAECIHGFITTFVEQMNKTVDLLFSYPLRIMPCQSETDDGLNLSYKFPLLVNGEKRSDVSKGSSGMHEVIDLAFIIAAMKALGLASYPLHLDEFGKALDPVHKQASNSMIIAVMELERFEQVFLVSHDIQQFSGVSRSEINVLHDANVQLPPNCSFNTALTMA